jgi:AraC-like DNA-binding protein/quercetin dioxygenase-like cupin family protein
MKPSNPSGDPVAAAPEFFSSEVVAARRFYLDLNPPKGRQLVVVCGGVEHCAPNYRVQRKTFPYFSIEYVARGRGEVRLKNRTSLLEPGRLFVYGPGISQYITSDAATPLVKYFVDFAGTRATELLRAGGLSPGSVSGVFPGNAPQPLFDELIQVGLQVRGESTELCAKLLECLILKIADSRAPLEGGEALAFSTYQRCRHHIELHSSRLRTLEQIARECHVNHAYLCRLFRRYDHQSPYQYLLRLKMNLAAERLQETGALVKAVAEQTGFTDPFHFSRVFRSMFGVPPAALRGLRQGSHESGESK